MVKRSTLRLVSTFQMLVTSLVAFLELVSLPRGTPLETSQAFAADPLMRE